MAAARPHGEWLALARRPRYPSFVLTVSLSRISAAMFVVSGVLLVLARTHSPALSGLTAAAGTIPIAISGPLLGAWLDVARSRRALIVADQLLSVVGLIAFLALAGHGPNWTLPAVIVLYSITRPLSTGSFLSALAEVAGHELLDRASAIEATSLNLGFVIGPALAGVLAGAYGPAVAIEIQAAATVLTALLIAINPVFDARPPTRPESLTAALRAGTRALAHHAALRNLSAANVLGNFSWSLMTVGFPLLAVDRLHAGAHAGGYLWAAVAGGSIVGTFVLAGTPSPRRMAGSYLALGVSALLWPLAGALLIGFLLVLLTGFLEGPAYSGVIALRQRLAPAAVRGQVLNTVGSFNMAAASVAPVLSGVLNDPVAIVYVFCATNIAAAALSMRAARTLN
jgi:MFS family permease